MVYLDLRSKKFGQFIEDTLKNNTSTINNTNNNNNTNTNTNYNISNSFNNYSERKKVGIFLGTHLCGDLIPILIK